MKKKSWITDWRLWVSGLLLTLSILLFAADPYKAYLIDQGTKQNQVVNITRDDILKNEQKEVSYHFEDVTPINAVEVITNRVNPKDLPVVGGIAIPSVSMNLPIYKGVSNEGMYLGAGTLFPDQQLGKGNYALASHYSIHKGLLFQPLSEVSIGDRIYMTDLDTIYVYQVTMKEDVEPTRVDVLDPTEEATCTLITCTPDLSLRTVVQGKLTEKRKLSKAKKDMIEAFNLDQTVPDQ